MHTNKQEWQIYHGIYLLKVTKICTKLKFMYVYFSAMINGFYPALNYQEGLTFYGSGTPLWMSPQVQPFGWLIGLSVIISKRAGSFTSNAPIGGALVEPFTRTKQNDICMYLSHIRLPLFEMLKCPCKGLQIWKPKSKSPEEIPTNQWRAWARIPANLDILTPPNKYMIRFSCHSLDSIRV